MSDWDMQEITEDAILSAKEKQCSVSLCEGGIWECQREELQAQLAERDAECERLRILVEDARYYVQLGEDTLAGMWLERAEKEVGE